MRSGTWLALLVLVSFGHIRLGAEDTPFTGFIQFSDGSEQRGEVTLAAPLELHIGKNLRSIPADQVAEIRLSIAHEELAAQWRMPEPGKPRKEIIGKPYPLREFTATVVTSDGTALSGHLYTTVAYVANDEGTRKTIIPVKQQGTGGETLATLVFPVRVRLSAAGEPAKPRTLRFTAADPGNRAVTLLTRDGLARIEAVHRDDGAWTLPVPVDPPAFLAVQGPTDVAVAWPDSTDDRLRTQLEHALKDDVLDYLDARTLLGVWQPPGDDVVFTLLMLSRIGSTTGDKNAKPWRIEVWRWRRDPLEGHLLVAGRGYFLRGTGAPPSVRIVHDWWQQRLTPDTYEVGHGK